MSKQPFFISGSQGQLAQAFAKAFTRSGQPFYCLPKARFDLTRADQVNAVIKELKPSVLFNCAAFNQVDLAESQPQAAFGVNAQGVADLAQICRDQKVFLVHYSTDYVFNGEKKALYDETDAPGPVNQYGASKLQGERAVQSILSDYLLLRVSWVFGQGEQNFLAKALTWAREKKELRIADDEISTPTFVDDIVAISLLAFSKGLTGLYHANNSGYCSRYAWVKFFFQNAGIDNTIVPVSAQEFPLPAKRPGFSAMSNHKLSAALKMDIPSWQDAVQCFIRDQNK